MRAALVLASTIITGACGLWLGCGGGQSAAPAPAPTPVATEPEPPPPPPEEEHVFYQVFWEDIHVLTVYRGRGSLRSEDPGHPEDQFSGPSEYMSAISHYFEKEPELAALAGRADTLEGFFDVLREEGYVIEEDVLEEGY